MNEKVTGYVLLAVGILIILLSAFNIYLIFVGQTKPVQIFNFPPISLDLTSSLGLPTTGGKAAPTELASATMLNDTSNFFAHLFILGFFLNVGSKIGSLGIELLRPVVVKLKSKEESS